MTFLKSHFWYNKRQRNGILFLLIVIILLQITFFYIGSYALNDEAVSKVDITTLQQKIDSLKAVESTTNKTKIYPFNPNYITDYKGYQLGMSVTEIDRLLAFREKGKFVNSVKEFQQVTGVSDSLLTKISPYFKFPKWVTSKNTPQKRIHKTPLIKQDINTATASDLKSIRGVGDKLAARIVKYRTKLQGFSVNEQLYEVWYLDKKVAQQVLQKFTVIKSPKIQKINVNTATFKQLLAIVYIDYNLTKKILNYRDEVAEIQTIEELKKIDGFPLEKFDRIALYLEAK